MSKAFLKELFYVLTGALIIFSAFELLRPGIVLAYINISWMLIFWFIIGIVIVIINREANERKT
ncbi:hypothetical protein DRH27_00400 [Candidatus Falkowbacteria bacterium]|nr:MAG: hypothetical protein DRH27_00400 [Candidatus Falkowbacteria bacterium]